MTEIIDLTESPPPEIIEISSDTSPIRPGQSQENKKRKKKGKSPNGLASDSSLGSPTSAHPSRAHSPETGNRHGNVDGPSAPQPKRASLVPPSVSLSTINEPGLFVFDGTAAPVAVADRPTLELPESKGGGNKLLLPSHVTILADDGPVPVDIIPPTKLSSDDEEYIEYLDYEDRKAPGLVRYFETEEETNKSKSSVFKCKNCGAEGDHKTFECPILICLTCGARDEHSTRSCPISKTCYTCGMKGHINKTCPNRFSARMTSSDIHGDCDSCGSAEHNMNECPTLWRKYQYVNDEERTLIMQSREEKKQLAIGEGGEGYIGLEMWCYNCANTGHLGDDCDELPHPVICPTADSAFSSHNVMSGPFYDPVVEPVPVRRGPRDLESRINWPRLPDVWNGSAPPVDVGKRGKDKDREKLEKRFREQNDEGDDWFNSARNVRRRGMEHKGPSQKPREKTMKFKLNSGGPSSPSYSSASKGNGSSLLARLSEPGDKKWGKGDRGREQHDKSRQSDNSLRIRGAATEPKNLDGKYPNSRKTDWGRSQDRWARDDRDKPGHRGSRRDNHGPRYKGGYDR